MNSTTKEYCSVALVQVRYVFIFSINCAHASINWYHWQPHKLNGRKNCLHFGLQISKQKKLIHNNSVAQWNAMPLILVHSNYQLTKYLSNKILKRHTFYCRSDSSKLIQRRPLELKLNPFTSEYSAQVYLSLLTTLVWTHLLSTYYLYENMASCCVTLQHNILFPKPKMNTFWNKFDNNLHYEYRDFTSIVASPSQSFECLKYLLLIFTMYFVFFYTPQGDIF